MRAPSARLRAGTPRVHGGFAHGARGVAERPGSPPIAEAPALIQNLELNPEQRAAVEHRGGPLLVIAGAGSGKTRVLTARVAHLLGGGVPPASILAFTFTNRAAREMRERITRAVGDEASRALWVGTFHATGVRILRREAGRLGLPRDFAIYDREDQEAVVRAVMRRLELPDSVVRPGALLARISDAKNALVTPEAFAHAAVSPHERRLAEAFALYQEELRRGGALDFDDLIAEVVRMFRDQPEVAAAYARRFEHVLVDEYQDTNHAQFRLVESLAAVHRNLFVVGDDDQSIYGWRGADLTHVLEFERAFPDASVLRLEQNYRSTGNILRAANAVIANNRSRKGKTLWCDREDGARLRFALAADEAEEARRVRRFLEERVRAGGRHQESAVLYRTNAQSRALETELRLAGIPYQIAGGLAFYQRREVKDVLAYLRLVVNPADTVAFWRIWNTPRRGLGDGVRARVAERMERDGVPPLEALRALAGDSALGRQAGAGAAELLGLLRELAERRDGPVDELLRVLLSRSGYLEHLDGDDASAADRRANVEELAAAVAAHAASARGSLADFLAESALVTDVDALEEGADRVLLLTAHNAKGLEFAAVVIAGLEEGLFPHAISTEEESELEEERRLFYVALTRARDQVLLTAAAYRRRFTPTGMIASGGRVSRFVDEIPEVLLDREAPAGAGWSWRDRGTADGAPRPRRRAGGALALATRPASHRAVGRVVFHEQFGRGVVQDVDTDGHDLKFTVRFSAGVKKVLGRFLSGGDDDDSA